MNRNGKKRCKRERRNVLVTYEHFMVLEHIGVSDEAHVEAEKGGKTMASSHYAYHQSIGYEQNAQRIDVTRDIKNQEIL